MAPWHTIEGEALKRTEEALEIVKTLEDMLENMLLKATDEKSTKQNYLRYAYTYNLSAKRFLESMRIALSQLSQLERKD